MLYFTACLYNFIILQFNVCNGHPPCILNRRDIYGNENFILVNRKVQHIFLPVFCLSVTDMSSNNNYNWYPAVSLKFPNQSSTQSLMVHLNII